MGKAGVIWGWLLAAFAVLIAAPVYAQAGSVGQRLAVCVRPAPAGGPSPELLLRHPQGFDCRTDQRAVGPGDFDVLSDRLPTGFAAGSPGRLRIASLWQDRLTVYVLYADGQVTRRSLSGTGVARHLQLGAIVETEVLARRAPAVRALWHVEGAANIRGIILGAHAATRDQSARSNLEMGAIYAGFAGLCIALLVYNLALWCALRHPFQLAYCAMLLTLIVYSLSSSGALAWLVPGIDNNDRMRINYLMLAACGASTVAFARSFFEPAVFAGWVGRLSRWTMAMLLGAALLFAGLAPWHARLLDRIYSLAFVVLLLLVPVVLVRAWRTRSNYLWLFAFAWGAPIGFATLRTFSSLSLIGWSFWVDNSTVLAMTVEGLLSSVAIAYRIHLLSRERDEAREREIAASLLADTDPLTGLLNRRAFLRQAIGRTGDQTLVIVDIDHFKHVNETLGHDGGDEVLRVIARSLRIGMAADSLLARIGGEEFALVMPAANAVPSAAILDRLRAARMPFDLTVTASLGSCTGPLLRETDWKALYRRADRALFAAKAAGRDRARDAAALAA